MTAPQWPSFGASAARPLPELTASVFLSASSSSIPLLPQRLATASGRRFVLPPCCNHNAARRVTGSGVCSLFHPPPAPPPPLARGRRVVRLFGCPAVMAAKHAHTHRRARVAGITWPSFLASSWRCCLPVALQNGQPTPSVCPGYILFCFLFLSGRALPGCYEQLSRPRLSLSLSFFFTPHFAARALNAFRWTASV